MTLTPGVSMLYVINTAQQYGLRTGILAVLGLECGLFCLVLLSTLLGGVLLTQYAGLYAVVRYLGAAYLLYLAYKAWPKKSRHQTVHESASRHTASAVKAKWPFLTGVLLNMGNPKVGLFLISLLPQFIPVTAKDPTLAFFIYGCIFNTSGLIVNMMAAMLAQKMLRFFRRGGVFKYLPTIIFTAIAVKVIGG